MDRIRLYLDFDRPLKEDEIQRCRELVRRRGLGEPVAYILRRKEFFGRVFEVGPGVLIPRPETEHAVEAALDGLKKSGADSPRILDLGCGSGCIGLTLAKEFPAAEIWCVDASAEAIEMTKRNARRLEVGDRVFVAEGDADRASELMETIGGSFDLVIANPPYIDSDDLRIEKEVKQFEPSEALFSSEKGLGYLKSWSSAYAPHLSSPGMMIMEMGTDQGAAMKSHYEELGIFTEVRVLKDLAGHDRIIQGVRYG